MVNELLEALMADLLQESNQEWEWQTTLSAQQIKVSPEVLDYDAYEKVATQRYPWTVLDAKREQARIFIRQFGLNGYKIMAAVFKYAARTPERHRQMIKESLKLTDNEVTWLTDEAYDDVYAVWGLDLSVEDPAEALTDAHVLAKKTGMTFEEAFKVLSFTIRWSVF